MTKLKITVENCSMSSLVKLLVKDISVTLERLNFDKLDVFSLFLLIAHQIR